VTRKAVLIEASGPLHSGGKLMAGIDTIQPTRTERQTAKLRARLRAHIGDWWPQEHEEFPDKDFNFYIEDHPCQIWSCQLSNRKAAAEGQQHDGARKGPIIWLLWDGGEVLSYKDDEQEDAFIDMINKQKARRLDSKLKYYTSPLTISAVLAIILFILIAALELLRYVVPDQLWSVFTAVVAFYFGRESARSRTELTGDG
jgi:hypothetical protein